MHDQIVIMYQCGQIGINRIAVLVIALQTFKAVKIVSWSFSLFWPSFPAIVCKIYNMIKKMA